MQTASVNINYWQGRYKTPNTDKVEEMLSMIVKFYMKPLPPDVVTTGNPNFHRYFPKLFRLPHVCARLTKPPESRWDNMT